MEFKIYYATDSLRFFIPYALLALDCNVSIIESVLRHCKLFLQCQIVERILQFANPACKSHRLYINTHGRWAALRAGMLEAAVRIIQTGLCAGKETFFVSQSQTNAISLARDAGRLGRKLYHPRGTKISDFIFRRKQVLEQHPYLKAEPAICIVDDYTYCSQGEELLRVVDKVVLCTSCANEQEEEVLFTQTD